MPFRYNLHAPYVRTYILSAAAAVTACSVFADLVSPSFPWSTYIVSASQNTRPTVSA